MNNAELVREWIIFLKSSQIVSTKSDPKTGKLNYQRKPKVQELIQFLKLRTDFDEEDFRRAIRSVMSKKGDGSTTDAPDTKALPGKEEPLALPGKSADSGSDLATRTGNQVGPQHMEPGQRQNPGIPLPQQDKPKKYKNDDAEDVEFREPGSKKPPQLGHKKPHYKYNASGKHDRLREALRDNQGMELSEEDIEAIFAILVKPKPKVVEPDSVDDEKTLAKKREYMRQLKQMIREVMNPVQRKALWRALSEDSLTEAVINRGDISAIFKDAAYLRSKPTGLGKIFKSRQKPKVEVEDLRQAWIDGVEPDGSDGESDDTSDIKRILLKFGYADKEIDKIFAQVLGDEAATSDDHGEVSAASKAVQKVADIAKQYGISAQLKSFIEKEFPEDLGLNSKKATYEDIKHIFTAIVQEERTALPQILKQQEQIQLGRTRK